MRKDFTVKQFNEKIYFFGFYAIRSFLLCSELVPSLWLSYITFLSVRHSAFLFCCLLIYLVFITTDFFGNGFLRISELGPCRKSKPLGTK